MPSVSRVSSQPLATRCACSASTSGCNHAA
jgi:hypothetical protein